MNFYKHHLGDYDGATAHLSWDEDMAYTRLLRAYYRREKAIPDAEKYRLARAASRAQKAAVDSVMTEFFELREDGWHNKRADEEIAAYQAQAETNRRIAHERTVKRNVSGSSGESSGGSSHGSSTNRSPSHKPEPEARTTTTNNESAYSDASTVALAVELRAAGVDNASATNPDVRRWAAEGVTPEEAREAVRIAVTDRGKAKPSTGYLVGIIHDLRNRKASGPSGTARAIASLQELKA